MKLYIDTNILIYATEDSKNPYGKDLTNPAVKMFWDAASCKYHLVISTWALQEFKMVRKLEDLTMLMQVIQKKIIKQKYNQNDIDLAKQCNPDHFQDELHILLAEKSKADLIVTRNTDDFKHSKIKAVKPEHLL